MVILLHLGWKLFKVHSGAKLIVGGSGEKPVLYLQYLR